MKKALTLILALALCVSLALPALAAEEETARTQDEIVEAYLAKEWQIVAARFDTEYGIVLHLQTSGIPHAGGSTLVLVTPDGEEYDLLDPVPRASMIGIKQIENLALSEDGRYLRFDHTYPVWAATGDGKVVDAAGTYYFETDLSTGETAQTGYEPLPGFADVPADAYYAEAVAWAASNSITNGKTETEFAPDDPVTRGQAVAFLRRTAGNPAASSTENNPFTDVSQGAYYFYDVFWAVEEGITVGTGDGTTFSPDDPVTYAEMLTFIARSMGVEVTGDAWQLAAAKWAVENNLFEGLSDTPDYNEPCPRSDVIYFLWRIHA